MIIFILLNLYIGIALKEGSAVHGLLISAYSFYFGLVVLMGCFIATAIKFKGFPFKLRYDVFASAAVLIWFVYWPDFFRVGSPVFDYYPLYFAFITAFSSLVFITKRERMDEDAVVLLQWLSDSGRFNPIVIMLGVMASLWFPGHFLLFPIVMTLWVIRFTLASCLGNE